MSESSEPPFEFMPAACGRGGKVNLPVLCRVRILAADQKTKTEQARAEK